MGSRFRAGGDLDIREYCAKYSRFVIGYLVDIGLPVRVLILINSS